MLRHLIRRDEISERIDADHVEVFRTVVAAEHLPVFLLTLPMFEQDVFHLGDQRERSARGLILHFVADNRDVLIAAPHRHDFLPDIDELVFEVDVRPGHPERFASAHTVVCREDDRDVEDVILRPREERAHLRFTVELPDEPFRFGAFYPVHQIPGEDLLPHRVSEHTVQKVVIVQDRPFAESFLSHAVVEPHHQTRRDVSEGELVSEVPRDLTLDHLSVPVDRGFLHLLDLDCLQPLRQEREERIVLRGTQSAQHLVVLVFEIRDGIPERAVDHALLGVKTKVFLTNTCVFPDFSV